MKTTGKYPDLAVRAASGVVMAGVAAVIIWQGGWLFRISCAGLAVVIMWEWMRITASRQRSAGMIILGVAYALVAAGSLIVIRESAGRIALFNVVILVIATDIGAYFAGRLIGGPKLAPSISPKKTWAGFFGGLLCAVLVGALFTQAADDGALGAQSLSLLQAALLSIVSQLGDLFESWLKRRYGVKDSSNLIPGHGGVMDRLDGLIFAAPLAALFMQASL